MMVSNRNLLFQWSIFVSFREGSPFQKETKGQEIPDFHPVTLHQQYPKVSKPVTEGWIFQHTSEVVTILHGREI